MSKKKKAGRETAKLNSGQRIEQKHHVGIRTNSEKQIQKRLGFFRFWMVVIILGLLIALGYWALQPASAKMTASLKKMAGVRARYSSSMVQCYSPASGIGNDKSKSRGIGFFGEFINLGVYAETSHVKIISPTSRHSSIFPGYAYEATVYKLRGKNVWTNELHLPTIDPGFWPSDLLIKNFSHPNIISKQDFQKIFSIELIDMGDNLNIVQLGKIPLGVWNPMPNSYVDFGYLTNVRYTEYNGGYARNPWPAYFQIVNMLLIERGNETADRKLLGNAKHSVDRVMHSCLDLIGGPVLIWIPDDCIISNVENDIRITKQDPRVNSGGCTAVLIRPPFATRFIAFPNTKHKTSDDDKLFYLEIGHEKDIEQKYLSAKDKVNKFSSTPILSNLELHPNSNYKYELGKDHRRSFSYPNLGEGWGFSLYGEVVELEIASVTGSFVVDSSPVEIGAPSQIKLIGISNLSTDEGIVSLMPTHITEFEAKVKAFYVNGEAKYRNFHKYTEVIGIIATILTIIGVMLGFYKKG